MYRLKEEIQSTLDPPDSEGVVLVQVNQCVLMHTVRVQPWRHGGSVSQAGAQRPSQRRLTCVLFLAQGQEGVLGESPDSLRQALQPRHVKARCLGSDQRNLLADAAEGSHHRAAAERAL